MKTARAPWGPLALLAAAVGAVHLYLLGASPQVIRWPATTAARPMQTRAIEAPAAMPTGSIAPAALVAAAAETRIEPSPAAPRRSRPAPAVLAVRTGSAAAPAQGAPFAAVPVLLAAAPAAASAAAVQRVAFAVPPPVRLHYNVTAQARGISLDGRGELLWRHDGDSYEAQLEVSSPLLPKRTQRSSGRITAQGLEPERFSDKSRHEEAAHFRRDEGKVSFSSNKPDAPLLAGAQDRLSVMLQLGAMIAAEPRKYPPGTAIPVQTASTRDAEPWVFMVEAREQLQLPGGTVGALKLIREPRREFDQKVELWLAPGMAYVPVRLRLTQPNGDWVDQQWSSTDKG